MKEKNMTALMCCYAKAHHNANNKFRVINDSIARKLLTTKEYDDIKINLINGIKYFNPNFRGTDDEALKYIMNNNISPTIIGRTKFNENCLKNAIKLGTKQYLIIASGYDTYAYQNNDINVWEIDRREMITDKKNRLKKSNIDCSKVEYLVCDFTKDNLKETISRTKFNRNQISFCSLLGISYYLEKKEFEQLICQISSLLVKGSSIVFDYPTIDESSVSNLNEKLAANCNELMKAKYDVKEIYHILEQYGFLVYEHLDHNDINNNIFYNYNTLNPDNKIIAPKGVNYCLAVKYCSTDNP